MKYFISVFLAVKLPSFFLLFLLGIEYLLLMWLTEFALLLLPVIAFAVFDIKSRYNEFRRTLHLQCEGLKHKLLKRSMSSACQRNVSYASAYYYGYYSECKKWFKDCGIKWYSIFYEIIDIRRYFSYNFYHSFFIKK